MGIIESEANEYGGMTMTGFFPENNPLICEAISNLAVKIHEYKHKYGKNSIILTGCGASDGATVISINLAIALACAGYKTLLIDADMRTSLKHRNRMAGKGFYDLICGNLVANEVICQTNIAGFYFLPSSKGPIDPALLFCSGQVSGVLAQISGQYDFVIIDCPSVTVVSDATALFMSVDGIILVCALGRTTKKQLKDAKKAVEPYSDKYYGLVVNSVDIRQYSKLFPHYGYYRKKLGNGKDWRAGR